MSNFTKTLRIAIAAVALGTAGFATTSVSTAGDASAWEGPKNLSNGPGKGGGGGAWPKPKGGHHGHHGGHGGHGGWGPGFGYGYGAGLVLGATMPIIVDAPDCYVVYQKKFIPGVGKVKQKVTVCD